MKRSEIVKEIARSKNMGYGVDFDSLKFEHQLMDLQVSDMILSRLEQLGMLPPEQKHQIEEGKELGFQGITRVSELKWEPEDE